jgi:hypothetical protein
MRPGTSYLELELKVATAVTIETASGTAVALFEEDTGELLSVDRLAPDAALRDDQRELYAGLAGAYLKARADR